VLRVILLSLALLVALPAAALADGRVISPGVSAGGVDLSGLTVEAATTRLEQRLRPGLSAPLVVRLGGRRFEVLPRDLGMVFDAQATATRAADAGAPTMPVDVGVAVTTDASGLARQAAELARSGARPARVARLIRITSREVRWQRARAGIAIDQEALAKSLAGAAANPASRQLVVAVRRVAPRTTDAELRDRYPSILTVDKRTFTLRLFVGLRRVTSYRIAHGQPAYPTPSGRFRIRSKQVNPNWYVPNAPWAGELGGSVVPGGAPGNPLKARWMGLAGGIGIHGTSDDGSIGSRASHGCVRMRVRDVVRLYRRVRVGTPVVIG
jgi:lipoprotein-anchoring transpeptidase ErfK/SrfK